MGVSVILYMFWNYFICVSVILNTCFNHFVYVFHLFVHTFDLFWMWVSAFCMCVSAFCMCVSAFSMCVSACCMCVSAFCMCVSAFCMHISAFCMCISAFSRAYVCFSILYVCFSYFDTVSASLWPATNFQQDFYQEYLIEGEGRNVIIPHINHHHLAYQTADPGNNEVTECRTLCYSWSKSLLILIYIYYSTCIVICV